MRWGELVGREVGYAPEVDQELRAAIETAMGAYLVDEQYDDVDDPLDAPSRTWSMATPSSCSPRVGIHITVFS
ncbi:DUF3052 family protein [Streptomyces sp. NPDC051109]|uniref:DUF3052 family protein n=1 Tax=Streptomyces sp. NPDC051109 TaxID=3365642 RepID=UPI003794B214